MTDSPPDAKAVAHAAMARDRLAKTQAYLQRGRQFAGLSDAALADLWIAATEVWATNVRERPRDLDDAEAEYDVRGQKAPFERAKPVLEVIFAETTRVMDGMSDEDRDRANREMTAEYEDGRNRQS